jgi:hypothetical protein
VIRQVSEPVQFLTPAARLVVPLKTPTATGSLLVVAFEVAGTGALTPAVVVVPDMTPTRWKLANDTVLPSGGRLAYWVRIGSHEGITEVIGETANAIPVTGSALAMETAGLSAGAAVQALADLLSQVTP